MKTEVIRGRIVKAEGSYLFIFSMGKTRKIRFGEKDLKPDDVALGDIVEINEIPRRDQRRLTVLVKSAREISSLADENLIRNLQKFNRFKKWVAEFFESKEFIPLATPSLVSSPGLEPYLDPFQTAFYMGNTKRALFLPTSPEFHLKKALCRGFEKIFEIRTCFRNGEVSAMHQPEFWMLEWYRTYENNSALITDIQDLLNFLSRKLRQKTMKLKIMKMSQLWEKYLNFSLTPQTTLDDLKMLAQKLDVRDGARENNFDDLFTRLWIDKIEPQLAKIKNPLVIHQFPPSQAALARLTPDGWADRFEFYWKGLEIANAFNELNDYREQRRRFEKDQKRKIELGKNVVPIDEEFMTCLEAGMPPAAGIALGLERLFMAFADVHDIAELRLFPLTNFGN